MPSENDNMYCSNGKNSKKYKVISKGQFTHKVIDVKTKKVIATKGDFMTAKSLKDKMNCGLNPAVKFWFE